MDSNSTDAPKEQAKPRKLRVLYFAFLYLILRLIFGWKEITNWRFPEAWFDLGFLLCEVVLVSALFAAMAYGLKSHINKRRS